MPEWLRKVGQFVLGDETTLSDQEYFDKHGYYKPYASAGILDLMSPSSAGKLLKTANEIKKAEVAARTAKQAKSLKDTQTARRAISAADEIKVGKSGRIHTITKSGPVASSNIKNTVNSVSQTPEELEAYKNAVMSANNALEMGNVDMARQFFKDADRFNPYFKNIFRKEGGIISAKSGIHIKKANRGKFTSYCGGKVTSECIARGKKSPNPAIRKRATFAANARKWKHQYGGKIVANWVFNELNHEV